MYHLAKTNAFYTFCMFGSSVDVARVLAGSDGVASCFSGVLAILTVVVAYPPRFLETLRRAVVYLLVCWGFRAGGAYTPWISGGFKYSLTFL
jgi:hypothetical protein